MVFLEIAKAEDTDNNKVKMLYLNSIFILKHGFLCRFAKKVLHIIKYVRLFSYLCIVF